MSSQKVCNEAGCQYSTDGVCMDNLGDDCPRILKMTVGTNEQEVLHLPKIPIIPDMERLPDNVEFLEERLSDLTYLYLTNLVLLIGEPECGKSTLYAALFDRFHKGGCADYLFAGTKTPVGFERRCHKARLLSQNNISKNDRTPNFEFSYLHLGVRHESFKSPVEHLLFADVNGEKFQAARDSDEEMQKMLILKKADHIFFVADGDMLINNGKRHNVKDEMISILKRALQNRMIDPTKGINLLITKWDKIVSAGKSESIEQFLTGPLQQQFDGLIKNVLKVASRSQNAEIPSGYGIDDFLKVILSSNTIYEGEFEYELHAEARQYQKFKYKSR
jgi:hypothetical protein